MPKLVKKSFQFVLIWQKPIIILIFLQVQVYQLPTRVIQNELFNELPLEHIRGFSLEQCSARP